MGHEPRITIGMPVFNGAATIAFAVESLLAQTCGDFELVISDNASTDSTGEIAQALAAGDSRVRYARQATNLGVNRNYCYVAEVARGEFLKWASASDWCAPTMLERCLLALDGDPDAVLAAPRTRFFVDELSTAEDYIGDVEILDSTPAERFFHLNRAIGFNNAMNGLIRTSALHRTRLLPPWRHSDMLLMAHLAILGKLLLIDEPLFYRRMTTDSLMALRSADAAQRFHYPNPTWRSLLPNLQRHAGWFRTALQAPMPGEDRLRILKFLTRRVFWERQALVGDFGDLWRRGIGAGATK